MSARDTRELVEAVREGLSVAERNSVTMLDGERSIEARAALTELAERLELYVGYTNEYEPRMRKAEAALEAAERGRDGISVAQYDETMQRAHDLQSLNAEYEKLLPREIGEDTYLWLPKQMRAIYEAIHEDETPTLERCFRRRETK